MKKVLAISPYFPPANTPDMQRLRMALPYFAENGWEVTVATADPSYYSAPVDEALAKTVPDGTRVLKLPCWSEQKCRRFGFGHLSNRIVWPWRKAVREILRKEKFDLVFFTTTQAMVLANGPYWRRWTGVPYVVDLQDPIYVPGGSYTRANAPGAYWKYRVSQFFSRFLERAAFACPSAVVATSVHYIEVLKQRYPHLRSIPAVALPFGLPERDLALVDDLVPRNPIFKKKEGQRIFFYAGRGGPDLHPSLCALFRAAKQLVDEKAASEDSMHFIFIGSSYAPVGQGTPQVEPLAQVHGCADMVTDEPERRPYFEVLKASKEADCVLVLGSKSADYTASKALGALAASRAVLAIVHRESLVHRLYEGNPKVLLCDFGQTPEEPQCMVKIKESILRIIAGYIPEGGEAAIPRESTAQVMTERLCDLFDRALHSQAK